MARIEPTELRKAVGELPDELRETYEACAVEGLDHVAAARRLGISTIELEARLAKALVRLDRLLG